MAFESKASGFNSFVVVVRDMIGDTQWRALRERLPAACRAIVDKPPLPMTWISDQHWNDIVDALTESVWKGQPDKFTELGRRQMHRDLNSLYKLLMHMVSPETVIKKASTLYSTYTKNGNMRARRIDAGNVEVVVERCEQPREATWYFHRGTILGTLECAGAKDIVVRMHDPGVDSCVYTVSWA